MAGQKMCLIVLLSLFSVGIGDIHKIQSPENVFPVLSSIKPNVTDPNTSLVSLRRNDGSRAVREVPEAMLDPYSVLGVLSFGVYIFYILYTRYRMRGHHAPGGGGGNNPQLGGGQQPPALFSLDAQENIANIIKMATKIISNAPYLGVSNSTSDADADAEDYFDAVSETDIRSKPKKFRK